MLKVFISDDQELCRIGLQAALEEHGTVQIVGTARNGMETLDAIEQAQPQIIVMDIEMPIMDGISATQIIKERYPDIKVVMLTNQKNQDSILASLVSGADAYCMKNIRIARLIQVMELILEGSLWLDPEIADVVIKKMNTDKAAPAPEAEPHTGPSSRQRQYYNTSLTDREMEILGHIVSGKSNKEIAAAVHVTIHTIKVHVRSIIQKLAVDDRTQAAVRALQEGLIKMPPSDEASDFTKSPSFNDSDL